MTIAFSFEDGATITLPWHQGISLLMACRRNGWATINPWELN